MYALEFVAINLVSLASSSRYQVSYNRGIYIAGELAIDAHCLSGLKGVVIRVLMYKE